MPISGIGRKFQKPTVFEPQTVWDNLLLALAGDRRPRFTCSPAKPPRNATGSRRSCVTTRLTEQRAAAPATCRTARSSGWKSACCWRKSRSLLLVDEPVAGMTDAETEQTAELLREINLTRSVVVVEHDMAFVRALGVKVTVLHEGSVLSEGSDRPCQSDDPQASSKCIWGAEHVGGRKESDLHYGAAIALRQVSLARRGRSAVTCLLGRNGVGKTSLHCVPMTGAHPISAGGSIIWEWREHFPPAAV